MFTSRTKVIFRHQSVKSDAFDVELLLLARLFKFKVREIPVTWTDSKESNFRWWKVVPRFLIDIARIGFRIYFIRRKLGADRWLSG